MPPKTEAQEVLAMITRRTFLKALTSTTALVAAPGALLATADQPVTWEYQTPWFSVGGKTKGLPTIKVGNGPSQPIYMNGRPMVAGDIAQGQAVTVRAFGDGLYIGGLTNPLRYFKCLT